MGRKPSRMATIALGLMVTACGPMPAWTPAAGPAAGGFAYTPPALVDARAARRWKAGSAVMSGVEANRIANETYHKLDEAFTRYLGGPELSNWLTFGKYASREVGGQIRSLESALEILLTFKSFDLSLKNDREALQALGKMMKEDHLLEQAVRVALGVGHDVDVCAQWQWLCLRPPKPGSIGLKEAAERLTKFLPVLRDALVEGNTEVYTRITAAYDVFLRAESRGADGVAALRAAAASGRVHDPLGYLVDAFAKYRQARQLALEAGQAGGGRRQLHDQRRELVRQANLLLAVQEQGPILQSERIFGDARVAQLTGAMSGRMTLTLFRKAGGAFHIFRMLPDGGNWADYTARMGFREVGASAEGAIRVVLPGDGRTRWFVPDRGRRGTIYDLFEQGLDGAIGEALRQDRPRDLPAAYAHRPGWHLAAVPAEAI